MKKLIFSLITIIGLGSATESFAYDKTVELPNLPKAAREFIGTHMTDRQISYATQDEELFDGDYKVVFSDGSKAEFTRRGQWKEIECKNGNIPASAMPKAISEYISKNCPQLKMVEAEHDSGFRTVYDIKLSDGRKLRFDSKGNPIR